MVLRVLDRRDVVLSGSGVVRGYGDPAVRQTGTGSGRVERAGG